MLPTWVIDFLGCRKYLITPKPNCLKSEYIKYLQNCDIVRTEIVMSQKMNYHTEFARVLSARLASLSQWVFSIE